MLPDSIGTLDWFKEELLKIPDWERRVSVVRDACFAYFIILSLDNKNNSHMTNNWSESVKNPNQNSLLNTSII